MAFSDIVDAARNTTSQVLARLADEVYRSSVYQQLASIATSVATYFRKQSPTLNNMMTVYTQSHEVRMVARQAMLANLVQYALPVMAYEGYIRPAYIDGGGYENYINYPMKLIFCGQYVCMFVNNTAYNLALSKSLTQFVPKPEKDHPCKCIETTRIAAAFSNAFHGIGNLCTVGLLYWVPRIVDYFFGSGLSQSGTYASYVVGAFAYGYCLVAMKYAHHGICAKHRRALVNNNKVYCFLVGTSFISLTLGGSYVLNSIAGTRENTFIDDAVFSLLYQFFIMFNMLKAGTLTTDKRAVELFYYQRQTVDDVLRYRTNKIVQELRPQENKQSYTQMANTYLDAPLVRYAASTTAISMLLSMHSDEISAGLVSAIEARAYPLWLLDYLPYFTPGSIQILKNILLQQGWEETRILVLKVIEIALKHRERADVVARLLTTINMNEDYVPVVTTEVDIKLGGTINAIEAYEPRNRVENSVSAAERKVERKNAARTQEIDEEFVMVDDTPESRMREWMGLP